MKERVTLTLESDLLKRIDRRVEKKKFKNRSHAVEMLLYNALGIRIPKRAIILAGGGKEKEDILLKEIKGRAVIEHVVHTLKTEGIEKATIIISGPNGIKDLLGSGKKYGVEIEYLIEETPLGTGGALLAKKEEILTENEPVVVCNADELKTIDLAEMYSFHKDNDAVATIALTTVRDPGRYGVAKMKGMRIIEFTEKPENKTTHLINAGLYIISPSIFEFMPSDPEWKKETKCMLESDVFPTIAKEGKLFGYPISGKWFDISTKEGFKRAEKEWNEEF
ncbi:hypothetical protein D6764_01005 [Candidatus Woesearchaeota archaeon]|nr:MAG: hypothetical protein D6764_01005 [Candidatus Woesearchaeota archaeon]